MALALWHRSMAPRSRTRAPRARHRCLPQLSDVLDSYYTAPAQPSAPPPPEVAVDSLLDQVPSTSSPVRGQTLPDVLRLAYRALGDTAATEADDPRARPSQGRDPRSP